MKKMFPVTAMCIFGVLIPGIHFAQGFNQRKDTVDANVDKGSYTAKVIIPKGSLQAKSKITFSIDKDKTDLLGLNVPYESVYTLTDDTKEQEATYTVTFDRDKKNDRRLSFNISVKNPDGTDFPIPDAANKTLDVYIRSQRELDKTDNEYWIFAGTNFDLLDGIKARDLYFRGSFLVPLNNANSKKHQLYITFEKNRFFSEKDSLFRITLTDVLPISGQPDSIRFVRGLYNSFREKVTENLGFSLSYIRNIREKPDDQYNFYTMGGIYIDHQNQNFKYSNHSIQADTTTVARDTSARRFAPLASQTRIQSWNINF